MAEREKITIVDFNNVEQEVELVTYLISEDTMNTYLVYTKGEVQGVDEDLIIYVSKIFDNNGVLKLENIVDEEEWSQVQRLMKKIANAKQKGGALNGYL